LLRAADLAASGTPLQALQLNPANDWLGSGGVGGVPAFWPDSRLLFVTDSGPGVTGIAGGIVALSVLPAPACTLQVAWSAALPNLGSAMSSPTVASGVVFVGEGASGVVHAYDASTGQELWNTGTVITGGTYAAPSIGGGKLFIGSWNGQGTADSGALRAFAPSIQAPPPPPPNSCSGGTVPPVLLGDQNIEASDDSNALGIAEAFRTSASGCGNVGSLSVYLGANSTAARVTVGLYSDANGHPGTLLGQGTMSSPVAGAWNIIPIPQVAVASGTAYWIAILGSQSGTVHFRDAKGGCASETSAASNLTALPSTWTSGSFFQACPVSAYGNSTP
jgi:hypothetical protein